jgi:hypothetical protein
VAEVHPLPEQNLIREVPNLPRASVATVADPEHEGLAERP